VKEFVSSLATTPQPACCCPVSTCCDAAEHIASWGREGDAEKTGAGWGAEKFERLATLRTNQILIY
jgi:hypothetical protein